MATQAKIMIHGSRTIGSGVINGLYSAQKSSAASVAGAPVKVASGYVQATSTAASQGASSKLTVVTGKLAGFLCDPCTASSTDNVAVAMATDNAVFQGNVIAATSASSNAKLAQTMVGTAYPIGKHASDTHWGVVVSTSSISSVASRKPARIRKLLDAASTVNGRVEFTIEESFIDGA